MTVVPGPKPSHTHTNLTFPVWNNAPFPTEISRSTDCFRAKVAGR